MKNINKHLEEKVAKLEKAQATCLNSIARGIILNWLEFQTGLKTVLEETNNQYLNRLIDKDFVFTLLIM